MVPSKPSSVAPKIMCRVDASGRLIGARSSEIDLRWLVDDAEPTLFRLFPEKNRAIVAKLLGQLTKQQDQARYNVFLASPHGELGVFRMTATPAQDDTIALVFEKLGEAQRTAVLDGDAFLDAVRDELIANPAASLDLVLIEFGCLTDPSVHDRLGPEGMVKLRTAIEAKLAGHAKGNSIGRVGDGSFGFVAPRGLAEATILADVEAAATPLGISSAELGARTESVELDAEGIEGNAITRALGHIRDQFTGAIGGLFGGKAKSLKGAAKAIDDTEARVRAAIAAGDVTLQSGPIGRIGTSNVAFLAASPRLTIEGTAHPIEQLLDIGRAPKLATEYDLAVIRAALGELVAEEASALTPRIVPVSPASLAARGFPDDLDATFAEVGVPPGLIILKVTGVNLADVTSPVFKAMGRIVKRGHRLCLTHFSAAIVSYESLKGFDGSLVEANLGYLAELCDQADGVELLQQLLGVWSRLGVDVIATAPQDELEAEALKRLKVRYVVGGASRQIAA